MSRRVHSTRRLVAVGSTALLLSLVSACGGDSEGSPEPQGDKTTATASATPSPTASVSAEPLSRFEDEPAVTVVRNFAAAVGQAVNANDRSLSAGLPYLTKRGKQKLPGTIANDLGLYYPGPLPFTPAGVKAAENRVTVHACVWTEGWAQNPDTKLPARQREISPVDFVVIKRADGTWGLDGAFSSNVDCSAVPVKGVAW